MNHCLILIARYNPLFVIQELFPEIEKYCTEFGILSQTAYDIFQKNKFAKNSLYFHHLYAETDIPINQEYEAIAFSKNFRIQPNSIQRCHSKILCFFTAVHTRPSDHAMRGHHELSLIQFEQENPPMIGKLFEVTEKKPLPISENKYIYLGSEEELKKRAYEQEKMDKKRI